MRLKDPIRESTGWLRMGPKNRLHWAEPDGFSNAGDLIGPYLFERITGTVAVNVVPSNWSAREVYLTAGSIAGRARWDSIVWGSGIMRADTYLERPRRVLAVRGPRTWARYRAAGVACPEVFGDPGLLLPAFIEPEGSAGDLDWIAVVPHYVDREAVEVALGGHPGFVFVDVRAPLEEYVRKITSCARVVSSSLHGLIVAHAYGIPAQHLVLSDGLSGDGVKFLDYYESIGMEYRRIRGNDVESFRRAADQARAPDPGVVDALRSDLLSVCPFREG